MKHKCSERSSFDLAIETKIINLVSGFSWSLSDEGSIVVTPTTIAETSQTKVVIGSLFCRRCEKPVTDPEEVLIMAYDKSDYIPLDDCNVLVAINDNTSKITYYLVSSDFVLDSEDFDGYTVEIMDIPVGIGVQKE